MIRDRLILDLTRDEGRRSRIYLDTVGKWTVGVGRNISDRSFSNDEIDLMLSNDLSLIARQLDTNLPWWRLKLNDVRQNVLMNMGFMGVDKLMGFKNMLAFAEAGKFEAAADEMLASKWATQVHDRAARLATLMRTGVYP